MNVGRARGRRRFEPRTLWRLTKDGKGVGYVVTTGPDAVAYPRVYTIITGISKEKLKEAMKIRAQAAKHVAVTIWRALVGFTLLPVDTRGRHINRGRIVSARFTGDGYFAMSLEAWDPKSASREEARQIALSRYFQSVKKEPLTASAIARKLGGRASKTAKAKAA